MCAGKLIPFLCINMISDICTCIFFRFFLYAFQRNIIVEIKLNCASLTNTMSIRVVR